MALGIVCFFILHTAALRPWHMYNGLPPPGRGQLVRPPRSPPTAQKRQNRNENKNKNKNNKEKTCSPGLDSVPSSWDRRLSTPVPALPPPSNPPSPTLHPSHHSLNGFPPGVKHRVDILRFNLILRFDVILHPRYLPGVWHSVLNGGSRLATQSDN
jgi:hypothetical protein